MRLFDDIQRQSVRRMSGRESSFKFLNTSARTQAQHIRDVLEGWFVAFGTDEDKQQLRRRFRSPDDQTHLGAFFELYCHALLSAQHYAVRVHPRLPSASAHPDFAAALHEQLNSSTQ